MIESVINNRKQQYGRLNRKYFISAKHGRKPQNCRWNFDAVYHSSRDISIFGLGGHIAISGCRSLSQSFGSTFYPISSHIKIIDQKPLNSGDAYV